jgi:hypothetical protein
VHDEWDSPLTVMSLSAIAAHACKARGDAQTPVSVTTIASSRISGERPLYRPFGGEGGRGVWRWWWWQQVSAKHLFSRCSACGGLNLGRVPSVRNASIQSALVQ